MPEQAGKNRNFKRFLPQNIILVLLVTAFCFVLAFVYYLSKPPIYEAKVEFSIKKLDGMTLDDDSRNRVVSIVTSGPVLKRTVELLEKQEIAVNLNNFNYFLSLREDKNHILLEFDDENATHAELVLASLLEAFRQEVKRVYPNPDLALISAIRSQRNSVLSSTLNSFSENARRVEREKQTNDLYAALIVAIGNRVAYNASIEVLNNLLKTGQSPLVLDFIANDPAVVKTTDDLNALTAEIANMETRLASNHPQIKAMRAEQNALKSELENNVDLSIKRLYAQADIATKVERSLRDELNAARGVSGSSDDNRSLDELEKKLKSIWDDYDKTIEKSDLLRASNLVVVNGPITIAKQSVLSRYGGRIFGFALIVFLLLLILQTIIKKCALFKTRKNVDGQFFDHTGEGNGGSMNPVGPSSRKVTLNFAETVEKLEQNHAGFIAVVGKSAAKTAARLSMDLKKENNAILLVDISTNEIGNLIGPHRGFTDVLTGDAKISEVIYNDYDTGVDILPQGLASPLRAKDFSKDIPAFISALESSYSIVIVAMSDEPEFGLGEIFSESDCLVISPGDKSGEDHWTELFLKFSTQPVFRLNNN